MRQLLYIMPWEIASGKQIAIIDTVACDQKFNTAQETMDWVLHAGYIPDRVEVSEYAYLLDENTAEQLNTSHLMFIYSKKWMFGHIPVGRIKANGPIVVCSNEYRGITAVHATLSFIEYIIRSSIPEDDIGTAKTLDQMLKEHKNVD